MRFQIAKFARISSLTYDDIQLGMSSKLFHPKKVKWTKKSSKNTVLTRV